MSSAFEVLVDGWKNEQAWSIPTARPFCCPVCNGRGTVAVDFYQQVGSSTSTNGQQCRTCKGEGIVWSGGG